MTRKDRFTWKPEDITIASCIACAHKHLNKATCKAFPQGIPDAILSGENDHTKKYRGDKGILYEPMKDK